MDETKKTEVLSICDNLKEKYKFVTDVKCVKGMWTAGKKHEVIDLRSKGSADKKVINMDLFDQGWVEGRDSFLKALAEIQAQEKNTAKKESVEKPQPTGRSDRMQTEKFRHPEADSLITARSRPFDRELFSRFRFARSEASDGITGNSVPVVKVSFDDSSVWRVLNGDIAGSICSLFTCLHPPKDWRDEQVEGFIMEGKQQRMRELRAELEEKKMDDPGDEELEAMIEESPEYIEGVKSVNKKFDTLTSLLDYMNAKIVKYLDEFSKGCRAKNFLVHEALSQFFKKAPICLILSKKLVVNYEPVTVEEGERRYTEKFFHSLSLNATWATLVEESQSWLMTRKEFYMDMPETISNDPDVPCFHYVDLSKIPEKANPTPAWDAFLQRMTKDEQEVFKAFVYSIYDAKNAGRQFIYFFDAGYSGKSCALSAIAEGLGKGLYASIGKESLNNQFGMSKVWDKRLVVYPDNKNKLLHKSQSFYNMTGHDPVDVEGKGQQSFSHRLNLRVIAAGNVRLKVNTDDRSEATRVIPINIKMTDDIIKSQKIAVLDENGNIVRDKKGRPKYIGDSEWPKKLHEEIYDFVSKCRDSYERLCPTRTDIILPDSITDSLESMRDPDIGDYEEIFNSLFEVTRDQKDSVLVEDMRIAVTEVLKDKYNGQNLSWEGFTEYMRMSLGIDLPCTDMQKSRKRVYFGLKRIVTDNEELDEFAG